MARVKKLNTKKKRAAFLEAYTASGDWSTASRAAGVSRTTAYAAEREDKDFSAACAAALDEFNERVKTEIKRRALTGVEREKVTEYVTVAKDGSETVLRRKRETFTLMSDRLLEYYASNNIPEYQKPTKHEVTGKNGEPIPVSVTHGWNLDNLSFEELEILAAIEKKAKAGKTGAPDAGSPP